MSVFLIVALGAFVAAVLFWGLSLRERRSSERPGLMQTGQAGLRDQQEFHPSPMQGLDVPRLPAGKPLTVARRDQIKNRVYELTGGRTNQADR